MQWLTAGQKNVAGPKLLFVFMYPTTIHCNGWLPLTYIESRPHCIYILFHLRDFFIKLEFKIFNGYLLFPKLFHFKHYF